MSLHYKNINYKMAITINYKYGNILMLFYSCLNLIPLMCTQIYTIQSPEWQ